MFFIYTSLHDSFMLTFLLYLIKKMNTLILLTRINQQDVFPSKLFFLPLTFNLHLNTSTCTIQKGWDKIPALLITINEQSVQTLEQFRFLLHWEKCFFTNVKVIISEWMI